MIMEGFDWIKMNFTVLFLWLATIHTLLTSCQGNSYMFNRTRVTIVTNTQTTLRYMYLNICIYYDCVCVLCVKLMVKE